MPALGGTLLALLVLAGCDGGGEGIASRAPRCGLTDEVLGSFVTVPPGRFEKGAAPVYAEERPTLTLHVSGFEMLAHEVTNGEFRVFVEATGYLTDAERSAAAGGPAAGSAVFLLPGDGTVEPGTVGPWRLVAGATWREPTGPGSDLAGLERHPVVHVSLADARAYATWAGARLPSEVEWEYAASLGLAEPADPVSGAYDAAGRPVANTWQGFFPFSNSAADGFVGAAPVGCFEANRLGLYDMIGNVWEWTDTPFLAGDSSDAVATIKGGSFLCADNFCRRYRPAARQPQETDFSAAHIGFRIVRDPD